MKDIFFYFVGLIRETLVASKFFILRAGRNISLFDFLIVIWFSITLPGGVWRAYEKVWSEPSTTSDLVAITFCFWIFIAWFTWSLGFVADNDSHLIQFGDSK